MASKHTTQLLTNLLNSGLAHDNPTVYDVLRRLIIIADGLSVDILSIQSFLPGGTSSVYPADITNFRYSFTLNNILLNWDSLGPGFIYEIREGTDWTTASYVTTALGNSLPLEPRVVGTYNFLIKAINNNTAVYSSNAVATAVSVPALGRIAVTTQIIDNNILFFWTAPTSVFRITHYDIYKGATLLGNVYATFFTYFEVSGGTFDYTIIATDIAGNSSPTEVSASLVISGPANYVNQGELTDTGFGGTKVDTIVNNGILYGPVDDSITYQNHFDDNSWASPQAQVTAGYPAFIQPTVATGTYEQVFDFGVLYANTVINITFNYTDLINTVAIAPTVYTSVDGSTWSAGVAGQSIYAASVRYVKALLTFTPSDVGYSFAQVSELKVIAVVKLENDGGNITAVSADAGGTTVTLTKAFHLIKSITTTVKQTSARFVVIDFDYTTVDPTTFKVLVFDAAGARITETIGWQARGILTLGV